MQISRINSYLKTIDQTTGDALNNQSISFLFVIKRRKYTLSKKRKLKLGANIKGLGNTTDGWRHPDVKPDASINIEFYKKQARI